MVLRVKQYLFNKKDKKMNQDEINLLEERGYLILQACDEDGNVHQTIKATEHEEVLSFKSFNDYVFVS